MGKVLSGKSSIARPFRIGVGVGLMCSLVLTAGLAGAQSVSTKSRPHLSQNQLRVLDGRAAEQYRGSERLRPKVSDAGRSSALTWTGTYDGPYLASARAAARRHDVPVDLFLRLVQVESAWKQDAVSPKGAIGLAQLMPGTAAELGVDPTDPVANLDGGARYLSQMHDQFRSWRLALAAYNAGPDAVRTHGGVPPYRETRDYVRKIWGR